KVFDLNVDGLAHVGLLPDLVKDMETIGMSPVYLDALFNSAEEYIRTWERADAISKGIPVPTPPSDLTCPLQDACIAQDLVPPDVTCPADQTVECRGPRTAVSFGAPTASADSCGPATIQGCTENSGAGFPLGQTTVTCAAIDAWENVGTCGFRVTVRDTKPPVIRAVTATPSQLWPPDRMMHEVSLRVDASDACDAGVRAPVCRITGITSRETA